MPVEVEPTPALPGLSPVGDKAIVARFDDGCMSSDGGLLVLREAEQRLDISARLAGCIRDPRDPSRVVHGLDEIIRTRLLMIAAGYEDGNDADSLRRDPMFKLAMGRLPGDGDLCSQPTISRFENLPDARALLRMGRAMVDHCCQGFRQVPCRIVLEGEMSVRGCLDQASGSGGRSRRGIGEPKMTAAWMAKLSTVSSRRASDPYASPTIAARGAPTVCSP